MRLNIRAALDAAPFQVRDGAALHVSHDLTDGGELPRKQLERGARGDGSRRRPVAVGEGGRQRSEDNFTAAELRWTGRSMSMATPQHEIQAVCDDRKLPLHVFPWRPEMGRAGLRRNAVYLVRPDGYVALADPAGKATTITSYLDARELKGFSLPKLEL